MFKKKVEVPIIQLHQMTRTYRTLLGIKDRAWSDGIKAKNAIEALRTFWRNSQRWTKLNYETLYCVDTKEVLYVKTEYHKHNDTHTFTMMWDKPEHEPIELEPK